LCVVICPHGEKTTLSSGNPGALLVARSNRSRAGCAAGCSRSTTWRCRL